MAFTFDGENKLIICSSGVVQISAADMYSRWKEWVMIGDNAKWPIAFENSVGGNPLGGGVLLGSYYFITNGWRIRPQNTDHTLIVEGNLFPVPDTAGIFAPTLDPHNVLIAMRTSSLTQQVVLDSGTGTSPSDIADAVWGKDISGSYAANTAATNLKKAKSSAALAAALSA